jgi:hypothetical protein
MPGMFKLAKNAFGSSSMRNASVIPKTLTFFLGAVFFG